MFKNLTIKNKTALILLACAILSLTACGRKSEPIAEQPSEQGSAETGEWQYGKGKDVGDLQEGSTATVAAGDYEAASDDSSDFSEKYINEKHGFSFNYPKDIVISEFAEGEQGNIILGQWAGEQASEPSQSSAERLRRGGSETGSEPDKKFAFQIFISEFDEPGPITAERIKQDLPEMAVEEPIHVIITKSKLTALIFHSQEEGLGKTREIWFVYNNYLYQITAYAGQDRLIGRVLEGWEFEK